MAKKADWIAIFGSSSFDWNHVSLYLVIHLLYSTSRFLHSESVWFYRNRAINQQLIVRIQATIKRQPSVVSGYHVISWHGGTLFQNKWLLKGNFEKVWISYQACHKRKPGRQWRSKSADTRRANQIGPMLGTKKRYHMSLCTMGSSATTKLQFRFDCNVTMFITAVWLHAYWLSSQGEDCVMRKEPEGNIWNHIPFWHSQQERC